MFENFKKAIKELSEESHDKSKEFFQLLIDCAELHNNKQQDYGSEIDPFANVRASQEFGISPWVGACMRLNDKVTRIKSMIVNGRLRNEPLEDSLYDIAVYALISL